MERIRRGLQSGMPAHCDPLHPRGAIFQRASSQSDVRTQAFWNREVVNKSLLFVAQVRRTSGLTGEGAALELNAPERQRGPGRARD
eukprot:3960614-Alexandrium_andersonii.AAC.1